MPNLDKHLNQLVDVVALSRKECERPIQARLAYATRDNFVGQIIDGYTPGLTDFALMTKDAAEALCKVQNALLAEHNVGLLIFDSYRPKRAVAHFVRWSGEPVADDHELARKEIHYPNIDKQRMFELNYVAEDSQHCYGHTVDLVLIDENGKELDLGACFDYMDCMSHIDVKADKIGEEALRNRTTLSETMQKYGFKTFHTEFWHYSFGQKSVHEPIDIAITADLKALNTN